MKANLFLIVISMAAGVFGNDQSPIELLEQRAYEQYLMEHPNRMSTDSADDDLKIVGGNDAAPGEAPFQMQLYRRVLYTKHFLCGGSLITPRTVLTAGHCVNIFMSYAIRYGSNHRLQSPYPDASVESIRVHPQFDLATVQNDLALFILKKPIKPSVNVRTIELESRSVPSKTNVTLYGFGLTDGYGSEIPVKLQKTTLQIVDDKHCTEYVEKLGVVRNPGMLCAMASGTTACNGDSGGPLVVSSSRRQIGVVSFGTAHCPRGAINVYTNVTYYSKWIKQNMV